MKRTSDYLHILLKSKSVNLLYLVIIYKIPYMFSLDQNTDSLKNHTSF
jgi:hypothetical protein